MIVTTILTILVILILIVFFVFEFLAYRKTRGLNRWPPWGRPLPCPDYWINKGNNICVNPFNLGTGYPSGKKPMGEFNMNNLPACTNKKHDDRACLQAKCKWAQTSNNPWFGVQPACIETGKCYCPN